MAAFRKFCWEKGEDKLELYFNYVPRCPTLGSLEQALALYQHSVLGTKMKTDTHQSSHKHQVGLLTGDSSFFSLAILSLKNFRFLHESSL